MNISKFITELDLARQSKILSGETATFDGKIEAGIPFSGYPTGVDLSTVVSLGVVSNETAVLSGNTGTTVFDVSNPLSPYYNPSFDSFSSSTWTNPLFSANTSGLTLPITTLSSETQTVGPIWTLTQTGMTGDYIIGLEYTGYSISYSFFQVFSSDLGVTFTGFTNASQENFSAGTLDYKGSLDYISSVEDATVDGRLITNKFTVTGGASSATTNYVLTQVDDTGKAEWRSLSGGFTGSCLGDITLNSIDECGSGITINSRTFFTSSNATGNLSFSIGLDNISLGNFSHSEGRETLAIGSYSHSEGISTSAVTNYSHAEGIGTKSNGFFSHAEGYESITSGDASHAEGFRTTATGNYSHSEGYYSIASGQYSHAEGGATGESGGVGGRAMGDGSHAEGINTTGFTTGTHAEGIGTLAYGPYSHSEGMGTIALGYGSHAEGNGTTSVGVHSHSEGSGTTAYGDFSHAGGHGSYSAGDSSLAQGKSVTTVSNYSVALGINSTASGVTTFVFGDTSLAANDGVIVLGNSLTGNTSNYVYVNSLNVKTVGSSAFVNDIRIDANGNLTTNTSDERLKENIQPISDTLDKIKSIQGVTYQWKDRSSGGDDIKLGFIAQQLESVEPKLVFTNKVDGFKGIYIDGIVSLLVESVKQQQSIIEKLNDEINSLKGRLDNLENL